MDAFPIIPRGYSSLLELLNREGDPLPGTVLGLAFTPNAPPTLPQTIGSLPPPPPGKAFFVQEVSVASQTAVSGRIQQNPTPGAQGIGSLPFVDVAWGSANFAPNTRQINQFIRSSMRYSGSALSVIMQRINDGAPASSYTVAGITGWQIADDLAFNARNTILCIHDSRGGGTGPSNRDMAPPMVIRDFYRDQGVDCRAILRALSGSTTKGHDIRIKAGEYDNYPNVALIVYDLGTNDAGQGYPTSVDGANPASMPSVIRAVQWKQRFYPNATMLIIGSPPVQDNTAEATLTALRNAQANYVLGLGDPLVKFFSYGGAFDRTVFSNYATTDSSGSAVHPRDQGLTQMYNGGYNGFVGLRAWLEANLPRIGN